MVWYVNKKQLECLPLIFYLNILFENNEKTDINIGNRK